MGCYAENLATLRDCLAAPCLGEVPHLLPLAPARVAATLDIGPLLQPSVA
jgi:dethiobiotin synthetase